MRSEDSEEIAQYQRLEDFSSLIVCILCSLKLRFEGIFNSKGNNLN